jgi:arginine:ornithine antiporter / lysine permease
MSDSEIRRGKTGVSPTLNLSTLTALVIGGMVGAGVFSLPRRFATETGVLGAVIAWSIAGLGMLMLAFVFQNLATRQPHLDSGVYAYAKAGFGEYMGFLSTIGYWASACVGNVTYWVLIMSTLGLVLPIFGEGDTLAAGLASSLGIWTFYLLVRRGVSSAAGINRIVTMAKIIPILAFILIVLFVLDPSVFVANIHAEGLGSLSSQVRATMLVTVFVFVGVEGASVYSRHAHNRKDVGTATVLGFLAVLAIFASVTICSYGVLPYEQIAELQQPSMAGVLEAAVGPWGATFVSGGLVISVLGAYLAWTLMAAELLFVAAQGGDLPRFLAKGNADEVPSSALLMSTIFVQVILVAVMMSSNAFDLALDLTAALTLLPYLLSAGYALKLTVNGGIYAHQQRERYRDALVSGAATLYTLFLFWAAGVALTLLSFLLLAPASVLFMMTRKEQRRRVFSRLEFTVFAVTVVGAIAALAALASGAITL